SFAAMLAHTTCADSVARIWSTERSGIGHAPAAVGAMHWCVSACGQQIIPPVHAGVQSLRPVSAPVEVPMSAALNASVPPPASTVDAGGFAVHALRTSATKARR